MKWTAGALAVLVMASATAPVVAGTITLTASRDNTLYEQLAQTQGNGSFVSNGAGEFFFAGRTNFTDELRRGLIAFDVAGTVPAGATIESVVLTLAMSRTIAGPTPVGLHRVLADWGEGASDASGEEGFGAPAEPGDATWIHTFYDTGFWAAPGGDFDGAASAVQTIDQPGSYSWGSTSEMVADVQSWLDNSSSNFGWLLMGDEATQPSAKRFNTRENADSATVPQLVITYQVPVPTAPAWSMVLLALLLAMAALWQLRRRSLRYRRTVR